MITISYIHDDNLVCFVCFISFFFPWLRYISFFFLMVSAFRCELIQHVKRTEHVCLPFFFTSIFHTKTHKMCFIPQDKKNSIFISFRVTTPFSILHFFAFFACSSCFSCSLVLYALYFMFVRSHVL